MRNLFIGLASAFALTTGAVTPILVNPNIIQKIDEITDPDKNLNDLREQLGGYISHFTDLKSLFENKTTIANSEWDFIKPLEANEEMPNSEIINRRIMIKKAQLDKASELYGELFSYSTVDGKERDPFFLPESFINNTAQFSIKQGVINEQIKAIENARKVSAYIAYSYIGFNIKPINRLMNEITKYLQSVITLNEERLQATYKTIKETSQKIIH